MLNLSSCAKALCCAGLLTVALSAAAYGDRSNGVYLEGGRGDGKTDAVAIGYVMPFTFGQYFQGPALTFYGDFFLSQWRAPLGDTGDKRGYTQIGAIANWRYRFAEGTSPWFAEAGIGVTQFDRKFRASDREFSSHFQFQEQLSVGRSFGMNGEHEVSLRVMHVSNGGISKPNPGENFVRLRYMYRF